MLKIERTFVRVTATAGAVRPEPCAARRGGRHPDGARNGMGKTTTIRTVMGQIRTSGSGRLRRRRHHRRAPELVARRGIRLVPVRGAIFPPRPCAKTWSPPPPTARCGAALDAGRVIALFPRLGERQAMVRHPVGRRTTDASHRPGADDEPALF